ncbi:winged helix-turn-helix transcriptional regulator [Paenirhodobacter populi]|uniref:winged helix-turn-helix transcriptional regulator n=1 Tax=Paenirhodobacter populi TaxID=2306993 RepID=UPI0030C868D9
MAVECPSRAVLRHLTSRWGVLVLIALQSGTHRFSDLRRKVRGVRNVCWRRRCNGWRLTVWWNARRSRSCRLMSNTH